MANSKRYNAEYYKEHRQEIADRKRKHYKENKEKILARNKRWVDANRDKWNAYMRERRKKAKLDKSEEV